ncbi:MAG: N-acyl-D-glucosamine 2-epimerase, partial [Anaerolineae bacterium]|nr:N-acyl-D-glucosamine 2-epimerase [Anaerolineae bacterium]
MSNKVDFTFSDLVAGYVDEYDASEDAFTLKTSDERTYKVYFTANTFAEITRNLGEAYHDATGAMREMMTPGRFLYAYGVFYPDGKNDTFKFEAKHIVFVGRTESQYVFEKQDWWINQIRQLADFYLEAEFGDGEIDFANYRTDLSISGQKKSGRQETDTISRLVYGFASAYLMTGDERYLEASRKGT